MYRLPNAGKYMHYLPSARNISTVCQARENICNVCLACTKRKHAPCAKRSKAFAFNIKREKIYAQSAERGKICALPADHGKLYAFTALSAERWKIYPPFFKRENMLQVAPSANRRKALETQCQNCQSAGKHLCQVQCVGKHTCGHVKSVKIQMAQKSLGKKLDACNRG